MSDVIGEVSQIPLSLQAGSAVLLLSQHWGTRLEHAFSKQYLSLQSKERSYL
jgi:hypothetical protein